MALLLTKSWLEKRQNFHGAGLPNHISYVDRFPGLEVVEHLFKASVAQDNPSAHIDFELGRTRFGYNPDA